MIRDRDIDRLYIERILKFGGKRFFVGLSENEISEKMNNLYFFGVITNTDSALDVSSDVIVEIEYYFSDLEHGKEITYIEKELYKILDVKNRYCIETIQFYMGFKKLIGYQVAPDKFIE